MTIRPGSRLVLVAAAVALATLAIHTGWSSYSIPGDLFWRLLVGVVIATALLDLAMARRRSDLSVSREVRPYLSVKREAVVKIVLGHAYAGGVVVQVRDRVPQGLAYGGLPAMVRVVAGRETILEYPIEPHERGEFEFARVDLVVDSPFGLWQLRRHVDVPSLVRVYPDFAVIARYLELVTDRRVSKLGIRVAPRRGEGLEFHQLREYREGDTLRQIDWKATARRRSLVSREFQEERDQRVVFLIDSGRRMRSLDGELTHFDHALNAMLLLGYVALRQGDTVSLLSFGASPKWVAPLSGVGSINVLLNEVYDLDTGPVASDYVTVAEEIMTRQRKRALVVVMTNLREEDNDLPAALRLIASRHVVMLANLRERELDETLVKDVRDFDDALDVTGVATYLAERAERHRGLKRYCHVALDTLPEDLPIRVVNAYWEIKRSGSL